MTYKQARAALAAIGADTMTRNQAHEVLLAAAEALHKVECTQPHADACDPHCPGWGLFHVNRAPGREIQRCDECNRFRDDNAAVVHVKELLAATIYRAIAIDWTAPGADL